MAKKGILGGIFGSGGTDEEGKDPQVQGTEQGDTAPAGDSASTPNGEESQNPPTPTGTEDAPPPDTTKEATPPDTAPPVAPVADAALAADAAPVEVENNLPRHIVDPTLIKNETSFNIVIIGTDRSQRFEFPAGTHRGRHIIPGWVFQHPEFKNALRERHLKMIKLKQPTKANG